MPEDEARFRFLPWAILIAIAVVACLVWLNDNPIFGAQPETITLSLMLGLLASLAALQRRRTALAGAEGAEAPQVEAAA